MDLTISIVSYNTRDILKRCLQSIYKYSKGIRFEIIVVDNGSKDGTVAMVRKDFPEVHVIANKANVFFAKANNQALARARGTYFLILNSDTYFVDNSLKKMVAYMEKHPNVGACEGLEMYEDGRDVPTGSMFSTPRIDFYELSLIGKRLSDKALIDHYRISNKDRKETFSIDVGCDAFLLVRSAVLKELGGYDESFSLYYTENDLCLRIKKLGWEIFHVGDVKVMHKVSASVAGMGWKKTDIYYKDLYTYYIKHEYSITGTLLFFVLKFEEKLLQVREKVKKR